MSKIVVAVDGPAGSGKSSVSKIVAQRAGLKYIDSGALYRSITWYMLEKFKSLENVDFGAIASREMKIEQSFGSDGRSFTSVNGVDVSLLIRDEQIAANIGKISDNRGVREFVNSLLRSWAQTDPIIMDGRDIGTVVFPDAELKIYCDASVGVRADSAKPDQQAGSHLTKRKVSLIGAACQHHDYYRVPTLSSRGLNVQTYIESICLHRLGQPRWRPGCPR